MIDQQASLYCPVCNTNLDVALRQVRGKIRHFAPIVCPVCVERQSRAAYQEKQKHYLLLVLKGEADLTLTAPNNSKRWHVRQVGDQKHTLCGDRSTRQWSLRQARLDQKLRGELCPACLEELDELRKKAAK
jgi:hypothetical protein